MSNIPARARVVVIGGGVVGCSVAYHLAAQGCSDVVLLERHQLGSGTTWHAAGNLETFRADPLLGELVAYGMSLYPELEAESEQSIGWHTCGRVMYTADPQRRADFEGLPRLGALRGVDIHLLSASEVGERLPILSPEGLQAGAWIPGDGRVNPVDLVNAYARAARRKGVTTVQRVGVQEVLTHDGRVRAVRTDQGDVECETVVLAAGLWTPEIAASCGASAPLHGVEHMYIVTKALAEVRDDLPMFLSYDERLYGRTEGGGLLVGFFDEDAVPVASDRLPADFEFSLLPPNWDQIEANLDIALRRFPTLGSAEIRTQYNGPESFTPDVRMLLGETAEVPGLFIAAGLNSSGIALAAGAGRLTAEWILDGRPSVDASRLDIRRFAHDQGGAAYRRARASEAVSFMCRRQSAGTAFRSARDLQVSPLHAMLLNAGALMGTAQAWERPLWFGGPDEAAASVAAEVLAARTAVTVIDRSSDAKFRASGPSVEAKVAAYGGTVPVGGVRLLVLVDDEGRPSVMPWVARLGPEEWSFFTEAEQATRLGVWLRDHLAESAQVVDESTAWAAVMVRGPGREELVGRLTDNATPLPSVGTAQPVPSAGSECLVIHLDPGPSLYVLVPAAQASSWYAALIACGADHGLLPAGSWAEEEAWVTAGIPRFGHEAGPSIPMDPSGVSGRRLRTFRAPYLGFDAAMGAPLVSAGLTVGYVTTAVPDGRADQSLLRGLVEGPARSVFAVVGGRDFELEPVEVPAGA